MAYTLTVTDGTDTVTLSSDTIDYVPQAAPIEQDSVSESGIFRFKGGLASARTDAQKMNRLLIQARRWAAEKLGNRVFVTLEYAGSDGVYRSLILDAVPMAENELLGWQLRNGVFLFRFAWRRVNYWEAETSQGFATAEVEGSNSTGSAERIYNSWDVSAVVNEIIATGDGVDLTFNGTLANFPVVTWPSTDLPAVTWTDINDVARTMTSNHLNVKSGTDAARVTSWSFNPDTGVWSIEFVDGYEPKNATSVRMFYRYGYLPFLSIAAGAGDGDMPTPAIIAITNNNSTEDMVDWWVGRQESGYLSVGVTTAPEILEGESATVATPTVDATCSNGNRGDFTTAGATNTAAFTWALSATGSPFLGETYLALARFTSAANTGDIENMYYQWRLATSAAPTTYLWVGEQMRPDTSLSKSIVPLGTIQIPPTYFVQPASPLTLADLSLSLFVQRVDGSNRTASIDFVLLMPTEGLVKLEALGGFAHEQGDVLTLDPTQENLYNYRSGTGVLPTFRKLYGSIMLRPGVAQRLWFLCHEITNYASSPFYKSLVELTYRPRRRII